MLKSAVFFLFFININLYAADLVHCNGACQTSCNDNEKILLKLIDTAAEDLLQKFQLKNITNDKQFVDELNSTLTNLAQNKKSLSEACIDRYCDQPGKKNMKLEMGSGLHLSYTNPVCDYTQAFRNPPINLVVVLLENEKGTLSQMTFNKNDNSFGIMIHTPSQKCNDNEGGTFDNTFVASLNSLAVVPNEGTTPVNNTPVGAQIIRKKKFVPKMSFDADNNLLFDLGGGYNAVVDSTNNLMKQNSLLNSTCKGSIIRNPAKKTSRLGINPASLNAKGSKVYDSNNYKLIEAETAKVPW